LLFAAILLFFSLDFYGTVIAFFSTVTNIKGYVFIDSKDKPPSARGIKVAIQADPRLIPAVLLAGFFFSTENKTNKQASKNNLLLYSAHSPGLSGL